MPLFGIGKFEKTAAKFDWFGRRIAWNDPSLRQVDFNNKCIGDDGAKRLAEALRGNTVVTALYLGGNSIGDIGAKALVDMLRVNSSVTVINLLRNRIGAVAVRMLAEALKKNSSITELHLGLNSIGDDGARALAEALKINSSISGLGLGDNGISDEGARALAEALRHNSSVTTLLLWGNSIGDDGARELAEMLEVNSSITDLNLWHNVISDEYQQRVDELTMINTDASTPEDARRLKLVCKLGWLLDSEVDAETAAAVELVLNQLGSFLNADQCRGLFEKLLGSTERGVAASVNVATARTLYRYATDCGAAPGVIMNLMRAHPSLCACRDVKHNLYPFMLLATIAEAGAGDVLELLLLNPNLVESGIGGPV